MRKTMLIFGLIFMVLRSFGQTDGSCVVHVEKHEKILYLYMNPQQYDKLPDTNKKSIIKTEAEKNSVKSVYVISEHRGELWNISYNFVNMVDSWNMNDALGSSNDNKTVRRSLEHPWFINFSGSFSCSGPMVKEGNDYVNFNTYGRFGFFLLKNRWDLAVNCLIGYNKVLGSQSENKGSFSNSIGFDTRVYFPLKQIKISPFVGLGMAYAFGGGNKSFTIPISVGINVPLKKGCVDVCWQYDKVNKSMFVVGYTFMLK